VKPEDPSKHPDAAKDGDAVPVDQHVYQIRVQGHLGDRWACWFEGLTIRQEKDGTTLLTGPMTDQAALHGLLVRIRNLCLPLISVNRVVLPPQVSSQIEAEEYVRESYDSV
jgi:hypothetical protein